jgi:hypothetical protein
MTDHRWAAVRLTLGLMQMGGATTALVLLLKTGASQASLIAVVVTSAATALSLMLFGRDRPRSIR